MPQPYLEDTQGLVPGGKRYGVRAFPGPYGGMWKESYDETGGCHEALWFNTRMDASEALESVSELEGFMDCSAAQLYPSWLYGDVGTLEEAMDLEDLEPAYRVRVEAFDGEGTTLRFERGAGLNRAVIGARSVDPEKAAEFYDPETDDLTQEEFQIMARSMAERVQSHDFDEMLAGLEDPDT